MSALARIEEFAARHERALTIVGQVWFWAGIAVNAGFIDLPEIPFVTDRFGFFAAIAVNAAWWAFVRPRIMRKRKARLAAEEVSHGGA